MGVEGYQPNNKKIDLLLPLWMVPFQIPHFVEGAQRGMRASWTLIDFLNKIPHLWMVVFFGNCLSKESVMKEYHGNGTLPCLKRRYIIKIFKCCLFFHGHINFGGGYIKVHKRAAKCIVSLLVASFRSFLLTISKLTYLENIPGISK